MSIEFESKNRINALIAAANATTGKADGDLTAAVGSLIEGFGDGANLEEWCYQITLSTLNCFGKSEAVLNLPLVTTLHGLFWMKNALRANTVVEHLTINCPNAVTSMQHMFNSYSAQDKKLKRLTLNVDTSKCNNFASAFYYVAALEVIDGTPLDFSAVTGSHNMFTGCTALKEVRFKGIIQASFSFSSPTQLSKDSISSIFTCLSDDATGKTITLNAACINGNYETAPGSNDGSTSDEWAALVATKSNWTISLV